MAFFYAVQEGVKSQKQHKTNAMALVRWPGRMNIHTNPK